MRIFLGAVLLAAGCTKANDTVETGDTGDRTCAQRAPIDQTLAIDPEGTPTQIHVTAAYHGDGIWLAYDLPLSNGNFEVVVLRMACDGTVDIPPFSVSEGTINQLDPTIAVAGDRVLVAWQSDNGLSPYNLDIHYQLLESDGTRVGGPTELVAVRGGSANPGNAWMPTLAPLPVAGFVLVGAWGHDESTGFSAFGQLFDGDGNLVGDTWDWDLQADRGQVEPTVSVDNDGVIHGAWREDQTTGASRIVAGRWLPNGDQPERAVGVTGSSGGSGARLSSNHGVGAWLAYTSTSGPMVVTPDGDEVPVGESGDHQPVVAAGEGGAAVAWYRNLGGLDNDVRIAWIDSSGNVSRETSLGVAEAAPYPPSLTAMGQGVFFAAWQEGDSPDFFLQGHFFER